ncbi:MAG TPA: c-type cytochrome domain-containing protein [Chryseosolibacter sp.]
MRKFFPKGGFLLIPLLVLAACYYDSEEILYPEAGQCNATGKETFSQDVLPLMNARCNNCHGGSAASAGIRLDSYSAVVKKVNDGTLMGSINQSAGFSPMPKNAGKMPACEIRKIQNWIDTGSPDN